MLLFTQTLLPCLFPLELSQVTDEYKQEELKNEMPEHVNEQVKDQVEESDVETDVEEVESDDDDDDEEGMETTPQIEDASVVKYSVKTTPYLQR